MVGGFWCRFIRIPFDGGPQRWSLDVCVMHTWYIASLRISQSGFEFVSITPSSGWGLECVFGRSERTGEGGFVFGGGVLLNLIFLTDINFPMSYRVLNFVSALGNGA